MEIIIGILKNALKGLNFIIMPTENDIDTLIASGILEMYVLGNTTTEEAALVEQAARSSAAVRNELDAIGLALERYGMDHAIEPDPTLRPFLMATIAYMVRLKAGEQPSAPPLLNEASKCEDYAQWADRQDLQLEEPLEDAFAHLIGYTPQASTAIVWLKYGSPPEVHTHEHERFLVLEGSCNVTIGTDVHSLMPGSVLTIPLYIPHYIQVTSECPCKVILQRVAA